MARAAWVLGLGFIATVGCQKVWGFEDFEEGTGAAGAGGGGGATGGGGGSNTVNANPGNPEGSTPLAGNLLGVSNSGGSTSLGQTGGSSYSTGLPLTGGL